jgi:hypothetical protein
MLDIRIIYSKEKKNIYDFTRVLFDGYSNVSLVVKNKVYTIRPGGVLSVSKYNNNDYQNQEQHIIKIQSPYIYNKADRFINRQVDKKFDYFGATFGQVFGLGFQDENKWYDAELIGRFLQLCLFDEFVEINPSKLSIQELYNMTRRLSMKQEIELKNNPLRKKPESIKSNKN